MYRIERRYSIPMGHRLSKHKGRCFSFHGHNFTILVGVKSNNLNYNDMVIDFSKLDEIVLPCIDNLDHCILLNKNDNDIAQKLKDLGSRVIILRTDPTAERVAEYIYDILKHIFDNEYPEILLDYVTVYENEKSKATFSEE